MDAIYQFHRAICGWGVLDMADMRAVWLTSQSERLCTHAASSLCVERGKNLYSEFLYTVYTNMF